MTTIEWRSRVKPPLRGPGSGFRDTQAPPARVTPRSRNLEHELTADDIVPSPFPLSHSASTFSAYYTAKHGQLFRRQRGRPLPAGSRAGQAVVASTSSSRSSVMPAWRLHPLRTDEGFSSRLASRVSSAHTPPSRSSRSVARLRSTTRPTPRARNSTLSSRKSSAMESPATPTERESISCPVLPLRMSTPPRFAGPRTGPARVGLSWLRRGEILPLALVPAGYGAGSGA